MTTYGANGEMWERFRTRENFDLAQKRSRLHKGTRHDVQRFERDREKNIEKQMERALSADFHFSEYKTKKIYEPKERIIYVLPYEDRIIQHAALNVLIPYYMRLFDYHSYSCIPGRGQTTASRRTMEFVRRYKWCYESDVHHCFPTINLDILSGMHHEKFRDKKFLEFNDKIIYSINDVNESLKTVYTADGEPYIVTEKSNCPIGNPTSQWYMNFYLNQWDLYMAHKLKLSHIRFCDNGNVYSNSLDDVKRAKDKTEEFYDKVLNISLSKSNIRRCEDGIDFVGYRHFPNGKLLVRKSTVKKQKKELARLPEMLEVGLITQEQMRSTIDSTLGWWKHAQTYHLKKSTGILEMREAYCGRMCA